MLTTPSLLSLSVSYQVCVTASLANPDSGLTYCTCTSTSSLSSFLSVISLCAPTHGLLHYTSATIICLRSNGSSPPGRDLLSPYTAAQSLKKTRPERKSTCGSVCTCGIVSAKQVAYSTYRGVSVYKCSLRPLNLNSIAHCEVLSTASGVCAA